MKIMVAGRQSAMLSSGTLVRISEVGSPGVSSLVDVKYVFRSKSVLLWWKTLRSLGRH